MAKLNRQGWEGLRDCLTRALDSRNRTLEDSINLTLALVTWIREQLGQASVSLLKTVTPEQETMASGTMEVVVELESQWKGKEKDKEAGVLLLLHSHMWLQIFLQPDLAVEVLEELKPVYSRLGRISYVFESLSSHFNPGGKVVKNHQARNQAGWR